METLYAQFLFRVVQRAIAKNVLWKAESSAPGS